MLKIIATTTTVQLARASRGHHTSLTDPIEGGFRLLTPSGVGGTFLSSSKHINFNRSTIWMSSYPDA